MGSGVNPLLKKPTLNFALIDENIPILLLPFRAVFIQVLNTKQPARQQLLRLLTNVRLTLPCFLSLKPCAAARSSLLILLDLSAAFRTVNHQILLSTSGHWPSQEQLYTALSTNVQVDFSEEINVTPANPLGVPQGSVLGPLLFSVNTALLGLITATALQFRSFICAWMREHYFQLNLVKMELLVF